MTEKQYGGASQHGFKAKVSKLETKKDFSNNKEKEANILKEEISLSKEDFENYIKAGKIVQEIRKLVPTIVKRDSLLIEIAEKIERKILELGGKPAFPVNTSLNEIAAHYTPVLNDETKAEGLLKVDFGVDIEGFIADNSMSFDLTDEKKYQEMIKLNEEILEECLDNLKYGSKVFEIGNFISEKLKNNNNYRIIKNLSGHSLAKNVIHAGLTIPNSENKNSSELKEIAIAIEPFLTTGKGEIYEGKPSDIFMLSDFSKLPRDREARKLLDFIKSEYSTKPFCKRWLNSSEELKKVSWRFALSSLIRENIVYNFPVLVEKDRQPVSQAEHSVIFFNGKRVVYTRD